jgi:hypothetical protein
MRSLPTTTARRALAIFALVAVCTLSACNSGGGLTNACELLPEAEIEQVVGAPLTYNQVASAPGGASGQSATSICVFNGEGDAAINVTVTLYSLPDTTAASQLYDAQRASQANAQDVADLGDRANESNLGQIYNLVVAKGRKVLMLSLAQTGDLPAQARQLAERALPRM